MMKRERESEAGKRGNSEVPREQSAHKISINLLGVQTRADACSSQL